MPTLPKPTSKVDIDPNYERQLRTLKDAARVREEALRKGNQVKWMRPLNWNGNPFDYEGMKPPFNRDAANQQFIDAVKNAAAPGVTGDLQAATLMIDYLGSMERAFRNRMTMGRCRRVAHLAGRTSGQGSDTGPLIQCGLEYLRRVVKRAKGPQ